jgi:hypothetical protein
MSFPTSSWVLGPDGADDQVVAIQTEGEPTDPVDLLLDDDGDLILISDLMFSTGLNAVAQGIRIRIQSFKGEWFLDLDHGVPYYQDLLGQKFNEVKARAAFRTAILSAPGVTELTSLEVTFDRASRALNVAWKTRTEFGIVEEELVLEV